MSTRCQIRVDGEPVLLYKHSDGYPGGVLPTLEKVVAEFKEVRGFFDGPYLLARIGQRFMNESDESHRKLQEELGQFGARSSSSLFIGYGYDTETHGDIEYLYTVKEDFSITINEEVP